MSEETKGRGAPAQTHHASEPWELEESNWCGHTDCIHGHTDFIIVGGNANLDIVKRSVGYREEAAQVRANMERIVACVNVCRGIPTADLLAQPTASQVTPLISELVAAAEQLIAVQCDLAAELVYKPDYSAYFSSGHGLKTVQRAEAAIAAMRKAGA